MNAPGKATVLAIFLALHGSASILHAGIPPAMNATVTSSPIADCVIDDPWGQKLLQQIDATKRLYTHPCNGGIYLADAELDPSDRLDRAVPVMQGWWLHEFIGARRDGPDFIEVHARFITGIGPTGTKPFTAGIRLRRTGRNWQRGEPIIQQLSKVLTGRPATQRIHEATSRQELEALGLTSGGLPVSLEVDFTRERLVVYPVRPAAGTNRVAELAVTQDGESYQLHCSLRTAQGVSSGATSDLIWFTLPNDGMPVELYREDRHPRAIPFLDFDSGVIAQGALDPQP